MLVYKARPQSIQTIAETRESHHAEQLAQEKFQRYQMAAIKDADLLIKLWSAMTSDHQEPSEQQNPSYQHQDSQTFYTRVNDSGVNTSGVNQAGGCLER